MNACDRRYFKQFVLAGCMAALLAACGGGGGDGGGTVPPPISPNLPPATGPGDPMNYVPVAAGDTWTYNAAVSDDPLSTPERDLSTVWVNGSATVKGQVVTVFSQRLFSDPLAPIVDRYYQKGPGGVAFYGTSDRDDALTNGVVPYAELLFPVAVGPIVSFTKTGLDLGEDLDGDGRNETVDATSSIRIDAFEPVTVPAGTFPNAAKRVNAIAATARLTATGQTVTVNVTETTWLAPGAGMVRSDTLTTAAGTPIQLTASLEARGYTVNGVRRGLGNPAQLGADLGPMTQLNFGEPPALVDRPAAASSGTSFLVLSKRYTPDTTSNKWLLVRKGFLRSPDGAVATAFDVGPSVLSNDTREIQSLAYGGGTYLAVFEQRNAPAPDVIGTTEPSIVVQRIAPNGTLTDAVPHVLVPQGTAPMMPGLVSRLPTLAFGGGQFLVVYCAGSGVTSQTWIEGRFVAPDGSTGVPFRISPDYAFNGKAPRVVFDGTNFVVATPDNAGWRLARVTPAGTVLDTAGVGIAVSAPRIRLATSGTGGVLVAWIENDATPYARRYGADLAALDGPPIMLAGGATPRHALDVAFLGGEYVALWTERYPYDFSGPQLVVAMNRLGTDGVVRGQSTPAVAPPATGPYTALVTPVPPMPPSGYTGGYALPALAVGADAALLAYVDGTSNGFTPAERAMALHGIWVHPFAK